MKMNSLTGLWKDWDGEFLVRLDITTVTYEQVTVTVWAHLDAMLTVISGKFRIKPERAMLVAVLPYRPGRVLEVQAYDKSTGIIRVYDLGICHVTLGIWNRDRAKERTCTI